MTVEPGAHRRRWAIFGVALGFLIGGDLLTTIEAVQAVGLDGEANPLARWLLERSVAHFLGGKILAGIVAIIGFAGVLRIARSLDTGRRRQFVRWCDIWLGALVLVGLAVVVNNALVVIVA